MMFAWRVALGREVWANEWSKEHRSLRRRLKAAVGEVRRMRRFELGRVERRKPR